MSVVSPSTILKISISAAVPQMVPQRSKEIIVREIDEQELLSMLSNMTIGATRELERLEYPSNAREHETKGYYQGRIDAWQQLHTQLTRELEGKAEAPRFFLPSSDS
jgi:hypothetical protein